MSVNRNSTLPPIDQPPRRGGPTVLRIMLGARLRRLRESKEITRQAAGHTIRASEAKMSRLELGRVGYKLRDIADLLTLYGVVDERQREGFLSLADQANSHGWWHKYSDVLPQWFELYVGLEQAAAVIRTYQAQFVPGLFQTEPYSRAVALLGHPRPRSTDADLRVDLRMARQELLIRPEAPRVRAVLDEAALRRPVGGPAVMRDQLRRLIELSELPNVTLQVASFLAGGHAAAGGSFSILSFADPELPDVAYMEQLTSAVYLDKSGDLDSYLLVMDQLCAEAASPQETRHLLSTILKES
ncbi:helix-turn-helix domain-containing protein [Pseudonocardia spinosispora]|uniref:helix-turn-helix domain-containing protein n=1 Tax=Pseudonocardia spinosispora TaxID=103441 RepID=UPI00042A7B6F|nr:helix-turn-helix transcriptional regulator [Pseudonocardia spinosispora]